MRMEEGSFPDNILNGKFHNTLSVGKPRTRWADVVRRDTVQILGIRGLRRGGAF